MGIVSKESGAASAKFNRQRANARNVSTSFLPYGGITYLINSFDYPNLYIGTGLQLARLFETGQAT